MIPTGATGERLRAFLRSLLNLSNENVHNALYGALNSTPHKRMDEKEDFKF